MLAVDPQAFDVGDALARFDRDGYALLGRVASDEALAALRARTRDLMLGQVSYPGLFFQHDTATGRYEDLTFGQGWQGPSENYRKIEKVESDPVFAAWIDNPLFERIARARIAGDVAIYRAVVMAKQARGGTVLPWHQDGGAFWGLDKDPELQIWTALDDAGADAGCVEVVPGSHRGGLATPLGGMIPKDVVLAKDAERGVVKLLARAGDAILIHNYAWHRSGVNGTDAPRRALSVCYMSAETQCRRKKRAPRVFHRVFTAARGGGAPGGE
jgi:ectoine hydroxylase-related dioxygenase (phytanoyl-CoA dioxygenase family)